MQDHLDFSIVFVALAPFLAGFVAPLVQRFVGAASGWVLAVVPAGIFVFLTGFIAPVASGEVITAGLPWISDYGISLSVLIDGLSLTFALLISGIGTIIVVYSGGYLKGHVHQGRFMSFILMFMGSMLGAVLADDVMMLFVFWELTTITSFLLIGFDHVREAARRAAIQALVVTGGGGLVLLAGLVMLHIWSIDASQGTGTWLLSDMRENGDLLRQGAMYMPILLMVLVGAFTKSAQFPFQFWLPNAMEAPTPVSAFLHSATMVKAGVYLLMRMNPLLGGTDIWMALLTVFGGITLLWGATLALRQTDLKQMLAQTTVASLGLLVLLVGQGTEYAIAGACLYLIAHAAYKGGLFLVAGLIDHGTGTREITELGGLMKLMPLTFAAAVLGGISMAGLPLTLGFLAKEEMYLGFSAAGGLLPYAVMAVAVLGNALMMAVGLAIAIVPFFGGLTHTPHHAHEGPVSMFAGPLLMGLVALAGGIAVGWLGENFLSPIAAAISGHEFHAHLKLVPDFTEMPVYVSILTWALGVFFFWRLTEIRTGLKALLDAVGWTFDRIFDALMWGLVRGANALTQVLHHGRLELYLVIVFVGFALAVGMPTLVHGAWPEIGAMPDLTFYEWGVIAIALIGLVAVLVARTRLVAIVSLGIQGFAVALTFMLFGAPDLSFTQFMVEVLSVVILALVMTRLYLDQRDRRVPYEMVRDGSLALLCGAAVSVLLLTILQYPLDMRLTELFAATSVPIAHGHNVVNVILVDYRGLDTFGEISVVMTAGIAIFALIRMRGGGKKTGVGVRKPQLRETNGRAAS